MKITFVLPCPSWLPNGGFKVVYEYANRLTARGHLITIIHPFFLPANKISRIKSIRVTGNYFRHLLKRRIQPPWNWFKIDHGIRMKMTPNLKEIWIPDADAIVATLWNTAECVAQLHQRKGHKFYFIQGLDTIFNQTNPTRIMNTWKLPLIKIVISRWLEKIAQNRGERSAYIPDSLDNNEFNIDVPIESRDPRTLCLINNGDLFKGTMDGLKALHIVKERIPEISILMFGVAPKPETTSHGVTYYHNPTTHQIRGVYNKSSIFIGTSWCEGFGLPPCEAAACGAALCIADNGGHREFAIHGETALVHPPKRPDILAENILSLLLDNEKRIRIARKGKSFIKKFSWDRSVEQFERTIKLGVTQQTGENRY